MFAWPQIDERWAVCARFRPLPPAMMGPGELSATEGAAINLDGTGDRNAGGHPARPHPAASLIVPYRQLAGDAFDVVLESSGDGVLEFVSQSVTAHLGWTPDELVGRRWRDLVQTDDRTTIEAAQGALAADGTAVLDARVRHRDGSYRRVRSTVHVATDGSGRQTGRIAGWRFLEGQTSGLGTAEEAGVELGGPLVGAMPSLSEEDESDV